MLLSEEELAELSMCMFAGNQEIDFDTTIVSKMYWIIQEAKDSGATLEISVASSENCEEHY